MARERMAKSLKYDHFEAISCHIITYCMTCQTFIIRRELCGIAISHPQPSDEDLAFEMISAASEYIGKLSELTWTLESRERRQNDTQSYKFVR